MMISGLKEYCKEHGYLKVLTYADLRALGFFSKHGFRDIEPTDKDKKLINRCDKSKLMVF